MKKPAHVLTIRIGSANAPALLCAVLAALSLTACNEEKQQSNGALTSTSGNRSLSVLGTIRPKADPNMLAKIKQEEEDNRRRQEEEMRAAQAAAQAKIDAANALDNPANRDLPAVNTNPISGLAQALGLGGPQQPAPGGGMPGGGMSSSPMSMPMGQVPSPPPQTASYNPYPTASGGGLIPPPPAVTLSTQAAPMYPPPGNDPYANPYANNPYANPYMQNPYMNPYMQNPAAAAAAPPQPAHPAGSMFSNGSGAPASSASSDEPVKKKPSIVLITPTGMEARSPYKQRDDLKVLVKAALANAPVKEMHDDKVVQELTKVDVGLPTESSKGNLSLTQRQIDTLFRTPQVDKKVYPLVKKIEADVAQSYYRYVYAFNKFTLTQQQVAARKQEVEVADSDVDKQRATADLSAAQNDAEAAKDDLHASQQDLASIVGGQAARSVIQRVSGRAPSMSELAVAENADTSGGRRGESGFRGSVSSALNVFNVFGRGHKDEGSGGEQATSAAPEPPKKKTYAPAKPTISSADNDSAPVPPPSKSSSGITFELKNVQTTPRKSVLKVAIKNNTSDNFNIDADNVSVIEGDHKLAEAAVRTEFDTGMVQPNGEVSGTITIFGRPWNDRLSVSLSDGGKTITLHR